MIVIYRDILSLCPGKFEFDFILLVYFLFLFILIEIFNMHVVLPKVIRLDPFCFAGDLLETDSA